MNIKGLSLKDPKSFLDKVSTGSGSDLVNDESQESSKLDVRRRRSFITAFRAFG